MKKLSIMLAILLLAAPATALWNDCPYGEVNDKHPGDCGRYIDTDRDGICDHSQPAPDERVKNIYTKSRKAETEIPETKSSKSGKEYNFIPITAGLLLLYLSTYVLSKKGKIMILTHRRVWNLAVLITFLISGITGLLLVLKVSYGLKLPNPAGMLFLHVEFGIAMAIITIFHIGWHWRYYTAYFKRR